MLSPKNSRSLILIFWPVTAPEQPRSNSMRKYSGIFPVGAAIFLICRGALGLDVDSFGATPNNPAGSNRNYPEWISRARGIYQKPVQIKVSAGQRNARSMSDKLQLVEV
jgi:hypothetical protein